MRTIWGIVFLGALSIASCTSQKPVAKPVASVAPPVSVAPSPSPTSVPLSAITGAAPTGTRSYGALAPVYDYLEWLRNFDQERLRAIALANANTKSVIVRYGVDQKNQQLGLPHDPAMPGMADVTQVQKETVAVVQRSRESFQQHPAPPECAALAQVYASSLTKSAAALNATVDQAAAEVAAMEQGNGQPGASERTHAAGADNGKAEMDQANAELDKLFAKYPSLQNRFRLRW